jgi:signal peptidase I
MATASVTPVTDAVEGELPEGDGAESLDDERPASRERTRNAVEWVLIVFGALAVAVVVKTFLIQAFFIPSLSMYSTLDKGDRVLVNKLSYHLHDIHRGDVVVFERPPGVPDTGIKDLIKRVVGLSGDTVESRDGHVYVNDRLLAEKYLDKGVTTVNLTRQTIPEHHIFVMGDNRSNSEDSRVFGPIDEDLVVGRAFVLVWPLPQIHFL